MGARMWERPLTMVQNFVANEYVAACGTSGITYLFDCNAGGGQYADIYLEDGTNLTEGSRHYFYACGEKHEAPSTDSFQNGYMLLNGGSDETQYWKWTGLLEGEYVPYEKIPVIIWTGDGKVHATTNLKQNEWETAKS